LPFGAALAVHFARRAEEWASVISARGCLDPELNQLSKLKFGTGLSLEQQDRLAQLEVYLLGIDNVVRMVESESRGTNAVGTVMNSLRMGIREISYEGAGLWRVGDGGGKFREYNEVTKETRGLPLAR
jgi:hypothetical protein